MFDKEFHLKFSGNLWYKSIINTLNCRQQEVDGRGRQQTAKKGCTRKT
jgi:hypothetical protein